VSNIEFSQSFGCDYCRDDDNRWYGHVTQVASDETTRLILLRCPICHSLYEDSRYQDSTNEEGTIRRLTNEEATSVYGALPPEESK
jgi:hypothetical protein